MQTAKILYGATEIGPPHFSADLLWRSQFKAPDPFILIEIKGKTFLFVSALEIGRAQKEAKVDHILAWEKLAKMAGNYHKGLIEFLKKRKIRKIQVPHEFPYTLGNVLEHHFKMEILKPLYNERSVKTSWEIKEIIKSQKAAEAAVLKAREFLKKSRIAESKIYNGKEVVTSEKIRKILEGSLYSEGFLGMETIVSSGVQASDPHALGFGPLQPYTPIVIDIFPVSLATHYYADMTRAFFKGKPSENILGMYDVILQAQKNAIKKMKAGEQAKNIWKESVDFFDRKGFFTKFGSKKTEGFFHGLGHGVGIDIHEYPTIGNVSCILQENQVVTVEPGLYYPKAKGKIPSGGIRIEDMMLVGKKSSKNLTGLPKNLEWAII